MDEDKEHFDATLYDSSDVTFEMKQPHRREIRLIAKASVADFNLVKYYLALKAFVEKIEKELDIMEQADGEH